MAKRYWQVSVTVFATVKLDCEKVKDAEAAFAQAERVLENILRPLCDSETTMSIVADSMQVEVKKQKD